MAKEVSPGVKALRKVVEDVYADARKAHGIESLPGSPEEALRALEADQLILDTLGEHVAANYLTGKWREWDEKHNPVVSPGRGEEI